MDWSWSLVMYALCVADGLVRAEPGTLVARRSLLGRWRITEPFLLAGRWHLLSFSLAFSECVVLKPAGGQESAGHIDAGKQRGWSAEAAILFARLVGAISLLLLVIGIPWATAAHGVIGLVLALCVVVNVTMLACMILASIEAFVRESYGVPSGTPRIRLHSPFAVPLMAATVRARALDGVPAHRTVRFLLARDWRAWTRAAVFDLAHGLEAGAPRISQELAAALGAEERAGVLAPPADLRPTESYCPRCGAVFARTGDCSDCRTVALNSVET
jgi:hypothetical protein